MILLSIAIVIAILVTVVLPIAVGFWINHKLGVRWAIIFYGAFIYFLVQTLMTLLFAGLDALYRNGTLALNDNSYLLLQVGFSILLTAILGVALRWAAMRYMKEKLDNLESAWAIGLGYGAAESIMVWGLPLFMTFINMLQNVGEEAAAEAWALSPLIPLALSMERITAFVLSITVTILVLQVFKRGKGIWIAAAIGLEVLANGLVIGLSEIGLAYGWLVLIAAVVMGFNLYLLYRLHAFEFDINRAGNDPER
jgi:uncharacterized membrane protein YhfC